ncbi:hypothetical protein AB1Y20_002001 [Prymnesium parvum]|uniref:Uncharacterized protein n=1 Tax=Prymnesium parvum TaxID=97485 RepID=A0AB34JAF6_PRYPA
MLHAGQQLMNIHAPLHIADSPRALPRASSPRASSPRIPSPTLAPQARPSTPRACRTTRPSSAPRPHGFSTKASGARAAPLASPSCRLAAAEEKGTVGGARCGVDGPADPAGRRPIRQGTLVLVPCRSAAHLPEGFARTYVGVSIAGDFARTPDLAVVPVSRKEWQALSCALASADARADLVIEVFVWSPHCGERTCARIVVPLSQLDGLSTPFGNRRVLRLWAPLEVSLEVEVEPPFASPTDASTSYLAASC